MTAVLNADDPMVAALGDDLPRVIYAGLDDPSLLRPELSHGADAKFCPRCGSAFIFEGVYFGHVGHYRCPRGDFARPTPDIRATSVAIEGLDRMRLRVTDGSQEVDVQAPLSGLYNAYNIVMALAAARAMGVPLAKSAAVLGDFTPAFGRMERTVIEGRPAVLLLAKNPTGFNEVLRTTIQFGKARSFLIALNDRIADGQDVSWIWDVDFEQLEEVARHIVVSGDRALDLRVRLKYAQIPADRIEVVTDWRDALQHAARATPEGEMLFILPTYTAMLELRAVLTRDGALQPYWQGRPVEAKPQGPNGPASEQRGDVADVTQNGDSRHQSGRSRPEGAEHE
jgi:UDP-N-acetylmuramyl tripeptide synthase